MLSDARCPDCGGPLALSDTEPTAGYRSAQRFTTGRPRAGVVYGLCARCALMIEDVALMLEAEDADRAEVLDAIDRASRARALFRAGDTPGAMSALAGAFRALRGVPGVEPWNPAALVTWLEADAASEHELACARFVLTVWNPGALARPFDAMEALAGWDRAHRAAFAEWARDPWWP